MRSAPAQNEPGVEERTMSTRVLRHEKGTFQLVFWVEQGAQGGGERAYRRVAETDVPLVELHRVQTFLELLRCER